jgi:superfamily II DNA or RNA helicase
MIELKKYGNTITLAPLAGSLLGVVQSALTQYRTARQPNGDYVRNPEPLYLMEEEDTLLTYAGFLERVSALIKRAGAELQATEPRPIPRFEPQWPRLAGVQLRGGQQRMLASIVACERGQYNGFTAMGKTYLIRNTLALYPQPECTIAVIAQQRPVVDAIYRDLCELYPGEVGVFRAGRQEVNRITVCTAKSCLKPGPQWVAECHMVFYDEVHTAGAPDVSERLTQFKFARMYGFSASTECRTDGANLVVEGLFGPVRERVTMEEGLQEGYAAKVRAFFYKVPAAYSTRQQPAARKRETIWRNARRNRAIQRVARHWEQKLEDPQILIMVDTLEHALELGRLLPDYELIYSSADSGLVERYQRRGELPPLFRKYTPKQRMEMNQRIEEGSVKRAISTTTLGTGVDMRELDVFIRADGGSSEVSNIQFRGRVARGAFGYYLDFHDFGDGLGTGSLGPRERAAVARRRSCAREGWAPELEDLP